MPLKAGALYGEAQLNTAPWAAGLTRMTNTAKIASAAIAAALIAAFVKITKETNEYVKALKNVSTLVDTNKVSMDSLSKGILGLNSNLGSATELTEGLYQAISAGVAPAKAVEFVGEAAKFATAALTDTFTAVDVLTTALNAYGLAAEDAAYVSDVFFETIKQGKVTGEELSASIGASIPLYASAKIPIEQLTAGVAALTKQGVEAANATTQLNAIVSSFLKPSEELTRVLNELGYESGSAFLEAEGLAGALNLVEGYAKGDAAAMAELFPNIRALRGAMALTGNGAVIFSDALDAINNSAGATTVAFEKQELSFRSLSNAFNKAWIAVGLQFYDTTSSMITDLAGMVDEFTRWAMTADTIGNAMNAVLNVINLALGLVGELLKILEPLVNEVFNSITDQSNNLKDVIEELTPVWLSFINNAVEPLIALMGHLNKAANKVFEVLLNSGIVGIFESLVQIVSSFMALKLEIFLAKLEFKILAFATAFEFVLDVLKPVINVVASVAEGYAKLYGIILNQDILGKMADGFSAVQKGLKIFSTFVNLLIGPTFDKIATAIDAAVDWIVEGVQWLISTVKNGFIVVVNFAKGLSGSAESAGLLSDALGFVLSAVYYVINAFKLGLQAIESFSKIIDNVLIQSFTAIGEAAKFAFNPKNWLLDAEEFKKGLVEPFSDAGKEIIEKTEEEFSKINEQFSHLIDDEARNGFVSAGLTAIAELTAGMGEKWDTAISAVDAAYEEMNAAAEEHKETTIDTLEETNAEAEELVEELLINSDEILQGFKDAYAEYYLSTAAGALEYYREQKDIIDAYYNDGLLTEEEYLYASGENWNAYFETLLESIQGYVDQATELIGYFSSGLESISDQYFTNELAKVSKFYTKQNAVLEQQLADGVITQEEYDAKKESLRQEQLEAENKLKEKQFKLDKAFSISSVWLDLATAIMGFWAAYGGIPFAGPIIAGALTAVATGIAIAQTALIGQQQFVPAAAEGGTVTSSGLVRVDEAGGEIKKFSTGDMIFPHDVSMEIAKNIGENFGGSSPAIYITIENVYARNQEEMDSFVDYLLEEIGRRWKLK